MITQVTMTRLIHRAVRRDLDRFTDALPRFTPGDHAHATALAEAFGHFDTMLTHHHEGGKRNLGPVTGDPDAGPIDDVASLTTEHESIRPGAAQAVTRSAGSGPRPTQRMRRHPPPASRNFARRSPERDHPGTVRIISRLIAGRRYARMQQAAWK